MECSWGGPSSARSSSGAILDASLSNQMATRSESLEWLLEVGDSLNVYRQGYALPPHLAPVLALLLGDELHPGSLAFQVRQIREHLAPLLPGACGTRVASRPLAGAIHGPGGTARRPCGS